MSIKSSQPVAHVENKALLRNRRFIRCQDFCFALDDIHGFLHRPATMEAPAQTVVFFRTFTATVPDTDQKLFLLLNERLSVKLV